MIRNYLTIAWRNFRRRPGYAFINIVGLAVGIACVLAISLYVADELAHDRHHEKGDRIARVTMESPRGHIVVTPTAVAPLLKREFFEVEEGVRLFDLSLFESPLVSAGEHAYQEDRFFFADSTVFDVFTLPFLAGNKTTALTRPKTLVLAASAAERYFAGPQEAIGQTLRVDGDPYEVTGVIEDPPSASHIGFDMLASFASLRVAETEVWHGANYYTYLLFESAQAMEAFGPKLDSRIEQVQAAGELSSEVDLQLEPLQTIYLDVEGRRSSVYLFSFIATVILLIACINYMNLSTAQATRRAKEIGVRKVNGAQRRHLVAQFYGESTLFTLLGLVLGVVLAWTFLPVLDTISGKSLELPLREPLFWLALLLLGCIVSLLSGSYPALLLSSLRPSKVLKGTFRGTPWAGRLRKGLVVLQFAASVFLLVATAVVYSQLQYIQTKDLGFQGEQVLALPLSDGQTRAALPAIKNALSEHPGIVSTAAIDRIPGYQSGTYGLLAEGLEVPEGSFFAIGGVPAEPGVEEVLGLEIIAGTGFNVSEAYEPESGNYVYLVNEATLQATGWSPEEAIGKRIALSDQRWGTLVGVFRDYHFQPVQQEIAPLAVFIEPSQTNRLLVRVVPAALPGALAHVEAVWNELVPHRPFTYQFLDEAFAALYESEQQLGTLFAAFAALAILIACLGLFGLAAFTAQQRTKEIGVRKVLGASVPGIVALLSKDFIKLVLAAFLLGAPVAYFAMNRWLENFSYRIELGPGVFAFAAFVALIIALATVSYHAIRAAYTDPAKSLRYE